MATAIPIKVNVWVTHREMEFASNYQWRANGAHRYAFMQDRNLDALERLSTPDFTDESERQEDSPDNEEDLANVRFTFQRDPEDRALHLATIVNPQNLPHVWGGITHIKVRAPQGCDWVEVGIAVGGGMRVRNNLSPLSNLELKVWNGRNVRHLGVHVTDWICPGDDESASSDSTDSREYTPGEVEANDALESWLQDTEDSRTGDGDQEDDLAALQLQMLSRAT
ncbi:MAG: hypothetical protein M1828_002969 [Chrysothrix sp. TS-e1954]|nr:MAG: hypothetical protein M1828_002969 [Chrysothrix sp. TS-e1954]